MIEHLIFTILLITGGASFTGYVIYAEAKIQIAEKHASSQIQAAVQADLFEVKLQKRALDAKSALTPEDVTFLRSHGWEPDPDALPKELRPAPPPEPSNLFMTDRDARMQAFRETRSAQRAQAVPFRTPTFIRSRDGRNIRIIEEEQ